MSTTEVHNAGRDAAVGKVDMKLEVQIVPVPALRPGCLAAAAAGAIGPQQPGQLDGCSSSM